MVRALAGDSTMTRGLDTAVPNDRRWRFVKHHQKRRVHRAASSGARRRWRTAHPPPCSGSYEALDRGRRLGQLLPGGLVTTFGRGLDDAVADVFLDEADTDTLQCFGDRAHLGEHVDAVGVLLDHPLDPPHLTDRKSTRLNSSH